TTVTTPGLPKPEPDQPLRPTYATGEPRFVALVAKGRHDRRSLCDGGRSAQPVSACGRNARHLGGQRAGSATVEAGRETVVDPPRRRAESMSAKRPTSGPSGARSTTVTHSSALQSTHAAGEPRISTRPP